MAGRSHQRKAKRNWSQETIRRRGVRAVVAGLRLKKEHQQLASEHAGHIAQTKSISTSIRHLESLTNRLREVIKQRKAQNGFTQKTGNSWNHRGNSDK
jgi:hypothetical protein